MIRRRWHYRWTIQLFAGLATAGVLGIANNPTTDRPITRDDEPSVVESFPGWPWARLILGSIGGMLIAGGVMRLVGRRLGNGAPRKDQAPRGSRAPSPLPSTVVRGNGFSSRAPLHLAQRVDVTSKNFGGTRQ